MEAICSPHAAGFALLLAVVDTSVFISGHGVIRRLVEAMEAADDPVRSRDAPPFQLRVQLVVPFQASQTPPALQQPTIPALTHARVRAHHLASRFTSKSACESPYRMQGCLEQPWLTENRHDMAPGNCATKCPAAVALPSISNL